ncbi:hypothetical protein TYRP_019142 [Tyrophagus putrescentiae]|nr:hypothetical protein TYRP_019142 [Tyrophagus putrescentiae]
MQMVSLAVGASSKERFSMSGGSTRVEQACVVLPGPIHNLGRQEEVDITVVQFVYIQAKFFVKQI